jgi:hypothetical protein
MGRVVVSGSALEACGEVEEAAWSRARVADATLVNGASRPEGPVQRAHTPHGQC